MILTIAKKEFTGLCRDGRYRLTVVCLLVLMLASSALGWANYQDWVEQAEHAAEHDYQRWRNQDPTHPHNAAHYGIYAFKTPRPLAILDSGIQPYIGASVRYGAHNQNEVEFPPAQDATALQRFGDLAMADVVRVLLPLLVIFLGFGSFAGEREQGTLRQLLSLGVKPGVLLWGKALGIAAALAVVLVPASVAGLLLAGLLSPNEYRADEISRAGLLMLAYGVYLGIFLGLSLAVSARCRRSRTALTVLLVFWVLTVFALPRGLLDLGAMRHPAPAPQPFWISFYDDFSKATNQKSQAVLDGLLQKYHVSKIEELPIDPTGLLMSASEEGGWPVIDRYVDHRFGIYREQTQVLAWGSVLSPAAGLSLLSMALSGNDLEQHRDFIRQVESQRRTLNTLLNDYMVQHPQKRTDELTGDQALWSQVPPFVYHPPEWQSALQPYGVVLGIQVLWLVLVMWLAHRSAQRVSVV